MIFHKTDFALCAKNRPLRTLKILKESHRHFEGDGKVIFTRPFLMLGQVTFDEQVNVLERYRKDDVS